MVCLLQVLMSLQDALLVVIWDEEGFYNFQDLVFVYRQIRGVLMTIRPPNLVVTTQAGLALVNTLGVNSAAAVPPRCGTDCHGFEL